MLSRRSFLGASAALVAAPALPVAAQEALPFIRLDFNADAVSRLLDLQAAKDDGDAAIDSLLALPAYKNVIRVGEGEGSLARDLLATNAKAVIRGTATVRSQPREDAARLFINNPAGYRALLTELEQTKAARAKRIAAHLSGFTPDVLRKSGKPIVQTVYLHFGGTWDALNVNGDIFLNLHYWTEYHRPSLAGLNMIVAHEAMHTVQNRAFGNPELQDTGEGAFFTALSKIQREGTARYVEVDTDPAPYPPFTYGFHFRAISIETVRNFATLLPQLQTLYDACFPVYDKARFVEAYRTGINNGGDFYALGHGAAKVIDERAGRAALLQTITGGPKAFWSRYAEQTKKERTLPPLPDAVAKRLSSLPASFTPPTPG
ncbi:MAG: twin-arginine translocation signal domain-containing protein [Armatimonadetes bacterium]|nr:twin-arginine translocation signal domain-containing protein [Armatimonadota bacterium]